MALEETYGQAIRQLKKGDPKKKKNNENEPNSTPEADTQAACNKSNCSGFMKTCNRDDECVCKKGSEPDSNGDCKCIGDDYKRQGNKCVRDFGKYSIVSIKLAPAVT
jgi:hypothetical protein